MSATVQPTQKQTEAVPPKSGRRVTEIRCTVGVQVGALSVTGLVTGKHAATMELHPVGVLIDLIPPGRELLTILIPFANLAFIGLE